MSDLIRREDVTRLEQRYAPLSGIARNNGYDPSEWWVNLGRVLQIPAVDAVPVVRCRECIHRKKDQADEQQGDTLCTLEWELRKLDWYCADGQRREDGLYESLKRGLEEAIAYENGEIECRTETREDGDI